MAVEYQNQSEAFITGTEPNFTMNAPAGFSAGDLFIAIVVKDDDPTITIPTGWTIIQEGTGADPQCYFSVSYRIAVEGDTSWTWTGDDEQWYGVILRYTGQADSGFIHASGKADGDSATPTAPSVSYTDLEAGSLALHCFGQDYDRIPYTSPDALIERYSGEAGGCGGAGGEKLTIIDSYSEANQSSATAMRNGGIIAVGQSFTAIAEKLSSCRFFIYKSGSPTGNAVAKLYAHTGTYGTTSKPIGEALAISDNFDVEDLTGSYQLITFNFTGANQYSLVNGTKYCISLEYSGGDIDNNIRIGSDNSTPTHSGNYFQYLTSWSANSGRDTCFYVQNNYISGTSSTGTAIFTTNAADEWLAVTVVIEAGVVGNFVDLAGVSAASATIDGAFKRKRNFIGEVIALSQTNGILKTNKKLSGVINALSQTDGILKRTRNFAGAVVALSQIDGVLRAYKDLVGEVIALSQTDCILKANKKLSGAVNALSQIDAILKTSKKFSGAIDAQSQTSAIWKISKKFSGAVSALSQIDGILQTKAFKDFIGTVSALSQTDALLARTRNFSGATDALSQVDGNLTRILALQSFVDTISQTDANIKVNKKFQGAVSALSQIDGILKRYRRLTGNVDAQSQTDALLKINKKLSGAVDALTAIDANLYMDKKFAGVVLALSQTGGLIKINKKFAGSVEALANILGDITIEEGEEEIIRKFLLFYGRRGKE